MRNINKQPSKKNRPRQLNQWLAQENHTRALLQEVREQQRLLALVRAQLPAELARHCTGLRLNNAVLSLYCESPVWASRLRFITGRLLSDIRQAHPGIASVQVKTRPQQGPLQGTQKPRRPLPSQHAASSLEQGAQYIADTALASAMVSLAKILRRQKP